VKGSDSALPSPQMNLLPGFFKAREALEHATRFDEVKKIRDHAEMFRHYAVQAKNREMEMLAAELRMRSERRAGQMLIEAKKTGAIHPRGQGNVPDGNISLPTLSSLNISRKEAMLWQRIAALPEKDFEEKIRRMHDTAERITTLSFLQTAFSSRTDEWLTPRTVLDAAVVALGTIDLDPCAESTVNANVPATTHYTKRYDGLKREWKGRVFMNPPYGDAIGAWVLKLLAEYQAGRVASAVALMPSRTDTAWFRAIGEAPVCFVAGRLHFSRDAVGAPFPSAIFYLGDARNIFAEAFLKFGDIYERSAKGARQ
jgi:hypothetical protein